MDLSSTTWLMYYTIPSLVLITTLIIACYHLSTKARTGLKLPPSPKPSLIPFVGHLHLLKFPLHRTYHKISQNLGPIMSLRLGTRLAIVVSSQTLVEECFTKNDVVLANRPRLILGEHLGYKHTTLSGSSYGDHWRNLRRIATVEILSTTRLNMFRSIRQDEVALLLRKLSEKKAACSDGGGFERFELRQMFSSVTFNVVMRMVTGRRYFDEGGEESRGFHELIEEIFSIGGVSNPADFLPFLRLVDYKGIEKSMERASKKMDAFLQGLIDERRSRDCKNAANTMIDHLLSLQETHPQDYTDVMIKGLILVMILAGTDTSAVTMEWAMSALLNHPEKLEKARAEIDDVVGPNRLISEQDLSNLPYLQNIVSETLRLYPATPLLVPHEAAEDCKIGGYDVPRGTILMVNAWAIQRDPAVWDDPESFKPERFEAGEVETKKLLTFGMGRRSCPGQGLANRVVGLTIGSLVQCFEWRRVGEGLVDMREGKGISMPKVVPLEAMCNARDVLRNVT